MAEKFQFRSEGDPPDPAEVDAERRRQITLLMDEAVSLEAQGFQAEGCHKRVKAICLHLGIRPTPEDGADADQS